MSCFCLIAQLFLALSTLTGPVHPTLVAIRNESTLGILSLKDPGGPQSNAVFLPFLWIDHQKKFIRACC